MSYSFMNQPLGLKLASHAVLLFWCILAAFPIFWIFTMSLKIPTDAFDPNPVNVITGPATLSRHGGYSLLDVLVFALLFFAALWLIRYRLHLAVEYLSSLMRLWLAWIVCSVLLVVAALLLFTLILPLLMPVLNDVAGFMGKPLFGVTTEHYEAVWFDRNFFRNFQNSLVVTLGVVVVSLTVGTLAGYGLSRSSSNIAFWLLVIALVFRALPHSVLVAGYLPVFIGSAEILRPLLGDAAPTLYGQPWAVIAVLVAINQPFTIWMLHSFFQSIPSELDEAARVDGCTHFGAFRHVIIPVMWPGVITTGLFSFLLAYNDFLVTSLLLDGQNMTMVPAIAGMFNRETTASDEVQAIAAAVSITAPLFILVLAFQRQIVSGLTAGAVKG